MTAAFWLPRLLLLAAILVACGGYGTPSGQVGGSLPGSGAAGQAPNIVQSTTTSPVRSEPTALTISINNNIPSSWPQFVADQAGIFAANDLAVNLQVTNGGPVQMAALLSGQLQVIQQGGIEALNAAANGSDVVMVALLIPVATWVFMVPASIHSGADLKGQKVGVPALGGGGDSALRVGLPRIGLNPDTDVSVVAAGSVPNLRAALISGAVLGATVQPLDMVPLQQQGFHALFDLAALKVPSPDTGIVVSRGYATGQRPIVQKYVDSLVQAIARMRGDRPLSEAVLKKQLKSEDDQLVAGLYDFYTQNVFPSEPYPLAEDFSAVLPPIAKTNPAVAGFDLNRMLDLSFVQSAVDRGLDR